MISTTALTLGSAQTIAWASSYYLPAMIAAPMARDLGISTSTVFAAFSVALLVSAPLGPLSGRLIDRLGGRAVLAATSVAFALGLLCVSASRDTWSLFAGWVAMGLAMGCGLYDAAFATLVRQQGDHARQTMGTITLIAGLASTVGWPLTAWMQAQWGWQSACWGWAVIHLVIGLPLNWLATRPVKLPAAAQHRESVTAHSCESEPIEPPPSLPQLVLLSIVFACSYFSSVAMAAHLPSMLVCLGASWASAVAAGALIGPAQVAGRLLELFFMKSAHPMQSARWALAAHPVGVLVLLSFGVITAPLFVCLHGLGNGVMTILRGTLPLSLFGAQGYGQRQGWLVVPTRLMSALAPFLVGWFLDTWGSLSWAVTALSSALAWLGLLWLQMSMKAKSSSNA